MQIVDALERSRAATALDQNLVVTAGAGTGKTSLIIERVLFLLLHARVPLERLAIVTFTEKAAAELRERLEDALERIVERSTNASLQENKGYEADRVFSHISGASESKRPFADRARTALESLDRANVTTLHSFSGEILRRHHRKAGVDVDFRIDADQMAFGELFHERWGTFLQTTLGPDTDAPEWARALLVFTIDEIESITRRLCAFDLPLEVVAHSGAEVQELYRRAVAQRLVAEIESIEKAVSGSDRLNPNFRTNLDTLQSALSAAARGEPVDAQELSGLRKEPTPGLHSGVADPESLKNSLSHVRAQAVSLFGANVELATDLWALVGKFVSNFRKEYLRRGWLSHDATIRLARDLLVRNPTIRRIEGERHRQLLIDEFQDTDPLQYEIALFLSEDPDATSSPSTDAFASQLCTGKLFIVGDAKQSIYRFRGADISAYRKAVRCVERSGGEVLTLKTNFRSVPEVITPLNVLFSSYFGDDAKLSSYDPSFAELHAARPAREEASIEVWSVGDLKTRAAQRRQAEAEAVARWIDAETRNGRAQARNIALLLRALPEVDVFLRALRRYRLPYIVEGGRGFYQRYEIELLIACLRMVRSPADPVPLVACLRSPLGAVPDEELQRYAESTGEIEARWSLQAEVDRERFPHLFAALETFREFAATHRNDSLDTLATSALDELPLRISMAASYEGAQRVANLNKAILHIHALAKDGRWGVEEILERIEAEDASLHQEADSPLADPSVDAVRVLSIHKAKGLEWPVVILPDLAREPTGSRGGPLEMGVTQLAFGTSESTLPPALRVRHRHATTPSQLWHQQEEKLHELSEAKRLFYVATTRAREKLVLVVGGSREVVSGRCPWVNALRVWGYDPTAGFGDAKLTLRGAAHCRWLAGPSKPPRRMTEPADPALVDAATAFARARSNIRTETLLQLRPPSSTHASGAFTRERKASAKNDGLGAIVGTALHRLLEAWDSDDYDCLVTNAPAAVDVTIAGTEFNRDVVLQRLFAILHATTVRQTLTELARKDVIGREVPLLYRDSDGSLWDGTIDLVTGSPTRPTLFDYKTDRGQTTEELHERYAAQLRLYAEAVQAALATSEARPATKIVALQPPEA